MARDDVRKPLRVRQTLGKYRIEGRLGSGGYADVFRAYDLIEGIRVAIKVPHGSFGSDSSLAKFRQEVRMIAGLDHPHILPLKNAEQVDGRFVIVTQLGEGTLRERLERRLSTAKALDLGSQLLDALAYAHEERIIHCDVKPENIIMFPDNQLRLSDFGIAKVMIRTLDAAGTGTVGYLAPEQAMGKPTFRSDVFSAAVVIWEMLSGERPEWPYEWPAPGLDRLRKRVSGDMVALLRRAMEVSERRRFPDAVAMFTAYERARAKSLAPARRRSRGAAATTNWRDIRTREFRRRHGRELQTRHDCGRCGGPVAESMTTCPWCASPRKKNPDGTSFPAECPRCRRGVKLDWKFCPWCYGPGIGPLSDREYSDVRYTGRCGNAGCDRKDLMPFMRYCPWCRRKVRRPWKIHGTKDRCRNCGWDTLREFWKACPWCGHRTARG